MTLAFRGSRKSLGSLNEWFIVMTMLNTRVCKNALMKQICEASSFNFPTVKLKKHFVSRFFDKCYKYLVETNMQFTKMARLMPKISDLLCDFIIVCLHSISTLKL